MNRVRLARAGLFLAHGGTDPLTGHRVFDAKAARRINALMTTCGRYDASGDFAFRVGLPGKSGVSGTQDGLRRSAWLETVRGHNLGSLACKPFAGSPILRSGRRTAPRSTASATAPARRC